MLFNSFEFVIFFPIVFILYWILSGNFRSQNIILLIASFIFYGMWDYRFLFLLSFSIFLDYFSAIKISEATGRGRKIWLYISIIINLGFLGFFKYYNFFVTSFADLLTQFGLQAHVWTLNIILPVGISFYTFHGLSYVIDIYNRKIEPTRNFVDYALFVSFFPLLVAGPIERASHLLPQIVKPRQFDLSKASDGLKQILWGLVKKMVIADGCAEYANNIFASSHQLSGSTLLLGAIFFSFQIYGDFSGYSDMALGVARLLGFELLKNFSYPYFSRDIAEFWRRWHISLSSWFKDYVYVPLGGSKEGKAKAVRNTFIIFLLSGFWHGASWNFIFWGGLNALYFLPLLLMNRNRNNLDIVAKGRLLPSIQDLFKMVTTFSLVTFAWIFFRAESLGQAFAYISHMFLTLPHKPEIFPKTLLATILLFLLIEWYGREWPYAIAGIGLKSPLVLRWSFFFVIILCLVILSARSEQFIYFQF